MATTLETLLAQLRDGTAVPADLERARALVQVDERIPAELRDEVLRDPADAEADAVGLLAVLGADDLGIADAVRVESGSLEPEFDELLLDDGWEPIGVALREGLEAEAAHFEIADAVVRRLPIAGFVWGPVLVDAVSNEAGAADVTDGVFAALDAPHHQAPVASAIAAEAGEIDIVARVLAALVDELPLTTALPVADAVRAEAGAIDVTSAVMQIVAFVPVDVPKPANSVLPGIASRGWSFAGVVLAAVALLAIVVGRLATPLAADPGLMFAHAGDVVVEDLSYGDNVQVFQTEGAEGMVILWLDEEA